MTSPSAALGLKAGPIQARRCSDLGAWIKQESTGLYNHCTSRAESRQSGLFIQALIATK